MTGRVEKHPHVRLRLMLRQRRSEGRCLCDSGVEISDLEVEVHHRTLPALSGGHTGRS